LEEEQRLNGGGELDVASETEDMVGSECVYVCGGRVNRIAVS